MIDSLLIALVSCVVTNLTSYPGREIYPWAEPYPFPSTNPFNLVSDLII